MDKFTVLRPTLRPVFIDDSCKRHSFLKAEQYGLYHISVRYAFCAERCLRMRRLLGWSLIEIYLKNIYNIFLLGQLDP